MTSRASRLSAVVLTLNEQAHLDDCLASLEWVDQVIVFDSYSTDNTLRIAAAHGAEIVQHPFEHYAQQRNAALQAVDGDWVLFVDADERIPPPLAEEIRTVLGRPQAGWWIPRHNYIFGRLTQHTGWYPDYQLRLLRRDRAHYDPTRHVHEVVELDGEAGYLNTPMVHLNYDTVAEFLEKQHRYTRYDAGILFAEGTRARPHNVVLQPLRHFYWRFVTLRGWRDGWHGLRLSVLMAYFQVWLYRYLAQLQRAQRDA